ncbi:unnamed protein product [Dicrocoelium dendriticum]|nr:unnamed protein product [Dicrocoelium dendriticum]
MSCDITRIFHTLARALESTEVKVNRSKDPLKVQSSKRTDRLCFWNRAESLRQNLHILANYLKRVRQLTGTSVGNKFKQKSHRDLTEQVTVLIDQCAALLVQLKGVTAKSECPEGGPQLMQHEQAICDSLEESLNKLRHLRNAEEERQRHLLEITASLATGVRSVSPSLLKLRDASFKKGEASEQWPDKSNPIIPNMKRPTENHNFLDSNLTEVELQSFERENQMLYQHLSDQRDELHLVARAVSEIGRLNQTLSTHLAEQLETAESIGSHFSTATEHIRQGNEFLQSALSSKATVQFWILFTMIVLTFSLHFLDWYYP